MSLTLTGNRWITLVVWTLPGNDVVLLSSEPYCTEPTDNPPNAEFIPAVESIPWSLAASAVVHRSGGGAAPLTTISLLNVGRRLDKLLNVGVRDTPIEVFVVEPDAAFSTAVRIARCQADRLESAARGRMKFRLRTIMDTLRRPIAQAFGTGDLAGQPQRVVLGDYEFSEGQRTSEAAGFVHISDVAWHSFTTVRDQGNVVTYLDVRRALDPAVSGLEFPNGIDGRLAIGVKGELWLTSAMLVNHTFTSWTGDNPDGWTVVESPPTSTVFQSGGMARFFTGGATLTCAQNTLTIGEQYFAFIDCRAVVAGVLEVVCGGVVVLRIDEIGLHRKAFIAAGTDFTLRGDAGGCDIILQFATCTLVRQTNRLNHIIYHLLFGRTGIDFARADPVSIETVAAAAPWTLGAELDGQTPVFEALRLALDNVAGDAWADLQGIVHVGRLRDPSGETSVAVFDARNIVPGSLTIRHDELAGLRNRINYRLSGSVHADGDLDTTDNVVRARLKSAKLGATSTVTVNDHYAQTVLGEPRDSWIRNEADAVAQLDHECSLVAGDAPALLIDWQAAIDPRIGLVDLQPFNPVTVQADEPTLDYGRRVLLFTAGGDLVRPWLVQLMGWSPSTPGALLLDDGGALLADDGGRILLGGT